MSGNRYQVFLSHANRDVPFVRQVAARLQREAISFFLDEAHLVPGEPWQVALERALGESDSCAVFIGDEGLGPYHTLETRVALSQQIEANRGFRLIPVLLPGKTRPAERNLPAFLKQLTWVEFTADADQDDTAWRRLKAGVTGESPGFVPAARTTAPADHAAQKIVPRGLRSFEPEDHGFYLKLVPGPRDERELPTVLRDWKRLIERIDTDRTFRVAYWYGPSGCGKSSLVKAGLIPVLVDYVAPVFVEASADDTEGRILRELRKVAEALPTTLGLADSMQWLREHPESLAGRKLLLVVDQFEQWLHAAQGPLDGDLVAALRLCDGRQLQCLLLVRDEFKVAVHRLMKSLEIEQRENFNYALIDLLDEDFAREVLFEYGRAYQRLPDRMTELSESQGAFLDRVISALRDKDGKVVSVQLALLAQMLEGQQWTPATLDQIGGAAGVGRAFFEEKFDKRSASAACQLHRNAAIKVLAALLPETGTAIKGRSRSRPELLEVSGYTGQPTEFHELIQILDGELRVITPASTDDLPCYQLTHDYLVPSLRDWLTAKQRESWRGQAMLRLKERTAEWTEKQGVRALPGPLEYVWIIAAMWLPTRRLSRPAQKPSLPQRRVLWYSTKLYSLIGGVLATLVLGQSYLRWDSNGRYEALRLANELHRTPDAFGHKSLVDRKLTAYRHWVVPELHRRVQEHLGGAPGDMQRVLFGIARADEAIALIRLKSLPEAQAAFQWRRHSDPEVLTQFIHRAKERGVTVSQLVDLYEQATTIHDVETRFTVLLTLSQYSDSFRPNKCLEFAAQLRLNDVVQTDPSSAIHCASSRLLRVWNLEHPLIEPATAETQERDWMVIRVPTHDPRRPPLDLTFVRISDSHPPIHRLEERESGDADYPLEVDAVFWLCDSEVTVEMFRLFNDDVRDANGQYRQWHGSEFPKEWMWESEDTNLSMGRNHPVQAINWEDAILFCNWLSRRLYRAPCYRRGTSGEWVRVATGDGFRLPTEQEWEYACRGRTATRYAFGSDDMLLRAFAVHAEPFTQPTGSKLPNMLGLYDMQGNVWEWCENRREDSTRVLKGGSWSFDAKGCRSAYRYGSPPESRNLSFGFRLALVSNRGKMNFRPPTASLEAAGTGSR